MSLALATLIYEWRRYLAAIIALAFSGMMVMAFSGMFAGIIHSEFATWERSRADLIILPANVKSLVNSNASLPARVKPLIYLNPQVVDVEPISSSGALWINVAKPGQKQVQTWLQVFGVQPYPNSVTLPNDLTEQQRIALMEPGAIAIDATAQKALGVSLGDKASLNGNSVYVRALLHNYQSPQQPIVVTSYATMRQLGMDREGLRIGPLMVSVRDPKRAEVVRDQLNANAHGMYAAQTLKQFNKANEQAVMGEQIIGLLLVFSVFLAVLIGIGVTSQTLRGAILSNIREFASLRALGISMRSLRLIVMELSFWAGIAGALAALLLTGIIALLGIGIGLPIVVRPETAASVCVMMMVIAIISGAMAMGILKKSQPADLLR
ncbi:MAG TPA: ABC transporter permease [Caulobacteraceae bacterium]|nr:ABC transporter permease [Caulobacteraceae bacterium]